MATETDPARAFAELCETLQGAGSRQPGDNALAAVFAVQEWSAEFYQILFSILGQADDLIAVINLLNADDDYKAHAVGHVNAIKDAFSKNALNQEWSWATQNFLNPQNIGPIRMLSPSIRPLKSFPKLDDSELHELIEEIETLLEWLNEHQLVEQDFIRQALIEGLQALKFRLQRLKFVGWGYTIDALKEVIAAYFALDRGSANDGSNPTSEAMKKMLSSFVRAFFEKAKFAKEVSETGDWMLKAYAVASLTAHMKGPIIGLLTGPPV